MHSRSFHTDTRERAAGHATELCMPAQIHRADALIGYTPIGPVAQFLLVKKAKPVATLPGGHVVHMVLESQWLRLSLQVRQVLPFASNLACNKQSPEQCMIPKQ